MKRIILLIYILFACGCASTVIGKDSSDTLTIPKSPEKFQLNCMMSTEMEDFSGSFQAKVKISGKDSISITVIGPLGIVVGKLYSDPKQFIFYNVLENLIITGSPSSENIYKAAKINLSYDDMISVLRAEPIGDINEYKIFSNKDNEKKIYIKPNILGYADFIVLNTDGTIAQYQRKSKSNDEEKTVLNAFLDDYSMKSDVKYPGSFRFAFSGNTGSLSVNVNDFKIIDSFDTAFRFSVSKSARVITLTD